MILAGIDEAGYGPLLGPLVVGCCAFEVDAPADGEPPCLWQRLRRACSKTRDRKHAKLHINDSKIVYSPSAGLKELERSVLAVATAFGGSCETPEGFLKCVAPDVLAELGGYPWYAANPSEVFPLEQAGANVRISANALRAEMERSATRCIHLSARVVLERRFNSMVNQMRNKGSMLFSVAAIHLDTLLRNFGDKGLHIFCDRQGGREHYGSLLRLMFEDWALKVLSEADGFSEYRLTRGGHAVRLVFREKAEEQSMSVALASMLCKYIREMLMSRFNAYWRAQVPGIAPTAGYYTDGQRFLGDIQAKRQELGIGDGEIVRAR